MNEQYVSLMSIALGAILINNFIFSQLLGISPFLEASRSPRIAVRIGSAVTVVMAIVSVVCWPVNVYILEPCGLGYMRTVVYVLVIAFLAQLAEMFFRNVMPDLYAECKGCRILLVTNCAVLALVLRNTWSGYDFVESLVCGVAGGAGITLAMCLFAGVRERLEFAECPKAFEGVPIALVAAGLLALCFTGFTNLTVFG